ncbi:MAG: hypothetical protein ACRC2V_10390 [Xenococcaceae cyanobacterium]
MHCKPLAIFKILTLALLGIGISVKAVAKQSIDKNKRENTVNFSSGNFNEKKAQKSITKKSKTSIKKSIKFYSKISDRDFTPYKQRERNLPLVNRKSHSLTKNHSIRSQDFLALTIAQRDTQQNQNNYSIDRQFQFPTAQHLRKGEIVFSIYNRFFFFPNYLDNSDLDNGDTAAYNNFGFSWGISDTSELSIEFQHFDSAFPVIQGDFDAITREGDNEGTIEYKQKLWQNESDTIKLSGIVSLSFPLFERGSQFFDRNGDRVINERRKDVVPALELPVTFTPSDRASLTISPTLAFFPEDSALFLRRPPTEDSGSFGTTFGFIGSASYRINDKITLWGDAFLPITGGNTVDRDSGKAEKTIAFNAGLRYLVNPQVGIDVFATNSLGRLGALALTADNELLGVGAGVVFMPDAIAANRRQSEGRDTPEVNTPNTVDGLGFFDGGTLNSGQALINLQGGSQGFLGAFRYGLVKDFEASIYLDSISDEIDESEQGFGLKARILDRAEGSPVTASIAGTIGLTNQSFSNFRRNDRNEFDRLGLEEETPFYYPGADTDLENKLYIITISTPIQYQFDRDTAVWLTPILGYVQREGIEIAGFNVGGSIAIAQNLSVLGEVGYNFAGVGNAFIGDKLADAIPWNLGIRWDLANLFGIDSQNSPNSPKLEFYITNRVGSSTWHQLRVRDQDKTAVGVGLSVPF